MTRILIAEDSLPNQKLLCYRLESQGYHVTTTRNGREALDRLEQENFDLVVLDITMPELDGIETLKIIRKQENTRDLPVIILTASTLIHHMDAAKEAGANVLLQKPVSSKDLLAVVRRLT